MRARGRSFRRRRAARSGGRGATVLGTSGMKMRASVGIMSRLQIGDSNMPPTITQASGCCTCAPMPVEIAAGTRPMQADRPVMNICRMRVSPASMMASSRPMPLVHVAADVGDEQDAIHGRDAEQRDEADRRRDAEIEAGDVEPEDAAADSEGNARERQQAVAHRVEQAVEQHQDQQQAQRHDEGEPLLGLHQRAELAGPLQAVAFAAAAPSRRCAPARRPPSSRDRGRARCTSAGTKRWLFSR